MTAHESTTPSPSELSHESITPSSSEPELFAKLKQEHDLAKEAVKSDNAEVTVDLWDQEVCRAPLLRLRRKL